MQFPSVVRDGQEVAMKEHVVIVGGGIAGPALALLLDKAGISSAVYEAYPQADDIGGGLQIAPNGMRVLDRIGVADQLLARGVAGEEFCFENQNGTVLARVGNGRAHKYGVPAVQMSRSVLHKALMEEVARRGITITYRKRLTELSCHSDGVAARFEDGTMAEGTILVGADGVHSRTREILFPAGPRPVYTGIFTVGGFASHPSLAPAGEAQMQRLHMIFGREGFFGYGYFDRQYPSRVMWWSHLERKREPSKQEYASWSTEELRAELLERHRGWHEPVQTILRSATDLMRGPIYDVPTLPAWSRDRTLLIGDAAHAISPHAGQGASLALEDAMMLAKLLRDRQSSYVETFALFEQSRRARVEKIIAEARRRGDGKRVLTPAQAWVRDRIISILMPILGERMNEGMYSYKIDWEEAGSGTLQKIA
jgi:2-polyprenyl-6-methoxyphenol hydroxylase-like FAD-dependent oxidoreductase